jgi:hypothetical protein
MMKKLLSGDSIEMIGNLVRALVTSQKESRKRLGDREAILLISGSTTWNRGGLYLPIPRDKSSCREFASPRTLRISYYNLACFYILIVVSC